MHRQLGDATAHCRIGCKGPRSKMNKLLIALALAPAAALVAPSVPRA